MRTNAVVRSGLLVLGMVALASCGGGDGPAGNNTSLFAATIDGVAWTGGTAGANAGAGGNFSMTGAQAGSGTAIGLTLYAIGAPGTYPLGVGPTVAGGIGVISSGASAWSTPLNGAAGTVTITAVSPTRIAGTFAFNAPPVLQGGAQQRVVTQGRFDLPVSGPATLVVPENASNKVTGTLAGAAFNAATVVSVTSPASGTFTFAGSTLNQTINVIISGYTGVGTYALGGGAARTVALTNLASPVGSWGGTNATTSGTLTVTSATAARITGSLTATLQAAPGQTAAPVTVSVAFEIGI